MRNWVPPGQGVPGIVVWNGFCWALGLLHSCFLGRLRLRRSGGCRGWRLSSSPTLSLQRPVFAMFAVRQNLRAGLLARSGSSSGRLVASNESGGPDQCVWYDRRRDPTSSTAARCSQPSAVGTKVMSPAQTLSGAPGRSRQAPQIRRRLPGGADTPPEGPAELVNAANAVVSYELLDALAVDAPAPSAQLRGHPGRPVRTAGARVSLPPARPQPAQQHTAPPSGGAASRRTPGSSPQPHRTRRW